MSAVSGQATDLVNIEVDGKPMQVPKNSMIIEATDKAGIAVPRFCYHRKLSIAANCRMCLVDVEKAPKPMPACATPVMEGMKVYTRSRRAIDAQHGVMEFLLINHPLDCPICDQGGECELQDLAMGYGRSVSRFTERKRVVKDKNVGPLIKTDMTRCIHCTRCVRFLEEVAGTSEMGGSGRGDRLEIGTCIENSIDSELSGNIIDLCPVGALTNKPFRYSARAWELSARPTHALHDGVGSSLYFHVRRGKVMRAVPRDAEQRNETWLADRDRYSHFGLYSDDRLLNPRIKRGGEWFQASWDEAMAAAAGVLDNTSGELGLLMSPSALNEEYFLAARLAAGLGSPHMDHRLRETDQADSRFRPTQFECSIADLEWSDSILLVGSNIRHEAPILGHRVRKAWLRGAKVMALNPLDWGFHFDLASKRIVAPQYLLAELARLALAVSELKGEPLPGPLAELVRAAEQHAPAAAQGGDQAAAHQAMAARLVEAEQPVLVVGQAAMAHTQAAWLRQLAGYIAAASGAALNLLPHGANTTGAAAAGAVPGSEGASASGMLGGACQRFLLWDFEPARDVECPAQAMATLRGASGVVAVSAYAGPDLLEVADVLLPLAPWPESEGSITNLDGQTLSLAPAGSTSGECRPGWKILRRLGSQLGLGGFAQVSLQDVQAELLGQLQAAASNPAPSVAAQPLGLPVAPDPAALYRVGELPMYAVDAMCRRSAPLQGSTHAQTTFIALHPAQAEQLGVASLDKVQVTQAGASVLLPLRLDERVPPGAAWLPVASAASASLGAAMGQTSVAPPGTGAADA
jgi:NADH-quinone oxidoreductase subunit G